jgi:hypothetical protein
VSPIRIQDTLSGETRDLRPDGRGEVGIYACGPTVYGRIHIGNARPYVIFTLLKRFLEHEGLRAKLVINVTDINDKIYDAAREAGEPSAEYAAEMTAAYVADTDALGLERPDAEPLASGTIGEIVSLIGALIDSGHVPNATMFAPRPRLRRLSTAIQRDGPGGRRHRWGGRSFSGPQGEERTPPPWGQGGRHSTSVLMSEGSGRFLGGIARFPHENESRRR